MSGRIKRFPRGQGHLLRDQILAATVDLLDETGDAGLVSIRAVAARVERSTPLIYEHFADRDELLRVAARSALDAMGDAVESDLVDEPDIATRLRRRAHAYVDFAVAHPEPYRILFMDRRFSHGANLDDMLATTGLTGVMRDLEAALNVDALASTEIRLVTLTLWAALHGVAALLLTHPTLEWPESLLDTLLDELRDGISPR